MLYTQNGRISVFWGKLSDTSWVTQWCRIVQWAIFSWVIDKLIVSECRTLSWCIICADHFLYPFCTLQEGISILSNCFPSNVLTDINYKQNSPLYTCSRPIPCAKLWQSVPVYPILGAYLTWMKVHTGARTSRKFRTRVPEGPDPTRPGYPFEISNVFISPSWSI